MLTCLSKIDKPISVTTINQAYGIPNDIYKQFGFSRHNGVDYPYSASKKVFCPKDGSEVVRIGFQPNGGGIFLGILVPNMKFSDGITCSVLLDFMHLESTSVAQGVVCAEGDLIAVQDNTGFSTGPHTHIQARRIKNEVFTNVNGIRNLYTWDNIDKNEANNSIDPEILWTKYFAEDVQKLASQLSVLQKLLSLLKKK